MDRWLDGRTDGWLFAYFGLDFACMGADTVSTGMEFWGFTGGCCYRSSEQPGAKLQSLGLVLLQPITCMSFPHTLSSLALFVTHCTVQRMNSKGKNQSINLDKC